MAPSISITTRDAADNDGASKFVDNDDVSNVVAPSISMRTRDAADPSSQSHAADDPVSHVHMSLMYVCNMSLMYVCMYICH